MLHISPQTRFCSNLTVVVQKIPMNLERIPRRGRSRANNSRLQIIHAEKFPYGIFFCTNIARGQYTGYWFATLIPANEEAVLYPFTRIGALDGYLPEELVEYMIELPGEGEENYRIEQAFADANYEVRVMQSNGDIDGSYVGLESYVTRTELAETIVGELGIRNRNGSKMGAAAWF